MRKCFVVLITVALLAGCKIVKPTKNSSGKALKFTPVLISEVSREITKSDSRWYKAIYVKNNDQVLRSEDYYSIDNGKKWSLNKMTPDFMQGLPYGYRRNPVTAVLDPNNGRYLSIVNALDTEGLPSNVLEPAIAQDEYYLRYRVSTDEGKTWLFDEQIIHNGYTARKSFPNFERGKNAIYVGDLGSCPLVTKGEKILLPVQLNKRYGSATVTNPKELLIYYNVVVLIGTWTANNKLIWTMSEPVNGDLNLSKRGFFEPTIQQFPDGRLLMVMRGSNGGKADPKFELMSHKWFSISSDEGKTWTKPEAWSFDTGETLYSPSSMSTLFRHSSGKYFWIGNVNKENSRANLPRYPLKMGQVNPHCLKLIKSTMITVDTVKTEDLGRGRIDFSHVSLIEDVETKDIIVCYPRSYNAYKEREYATVRYSVK